MQGSVFHLALTNQDDGKHHPHVVVLTFVGNRDCIVVPAYSADGFKVAEYIKAAKQDGLRDDQIFVQLDNAQDIDFSANFTPREAIWCVGRHRRLSQSAVLQGHRLGQMKASGLRKICESLLSLCETDPRSLSKHAIKDLRNLLASLSEEPQQAKPDDSI